MYSCAAQSPAYPRADASPAGRTDTAVTEAPPPQARRAQPPPRPPDATRATTELASPLRKRTAPSIPVEISAGDNSSPRTARATAAATRPNRARRPARQTHARSRALSAPYRTARSRRTGTASERQCESAQQHPPAQPHQATRRGISRSMPLRFPCPRFTLTIFETPGSCIVTP
jgi:hypothetical protein